MSIRGAYGFYKNGVTKITYNHSESQLSQLGQKLVKFINSVELRHLNMIFNNIELVEENEKPNIKQIRECSKYIDIEATDTWYDLLNSIQGDLTPYIKGLRYMTDAEDFIKNSIMCEYAYIINLDMNCFEVYRGFQTKPQDNRYLTQKPIDDKYQFYNCRLICDFMLPNIPKSWQEIVFKNLTPFERSFDSLHNLKVEYMNNNSILPVLSMEPGEDINQKIKDILQHIFKNDN